ncbi:hypothetical protein M0L20_15150 [Spirosoma sp. RP8]|uniref:BBC1/AIM3 cysteine proteinase-fold domain-containing protein n=1 Tax=Spirosoma liriopis TaxID=2937440 RepID=A0ABT0HM22_9BACT|nr:hypothetical protein [Spirosoma liriopis]MCK8493203.1 hypothetical protein [Spirosoma liriopis]
MNATNLSVAGFAYSQYGNQVKRGECWDLAEEALKYAGAKTSNDIMGSKNVTANADYRWGTPIQVMDVEPGDIIQFRNYTTKVTSDTGWQTQSRPHHTAIVAAVYPVIGAKVVAVYEQNVANNRTVQINTLYLSSGTGLNWGESVAVTGKIWAYRPIKK